MSESPVLARLKRLVPDAIESIAEELGEIRVTVEPGHLKRVMGKLLNDEILGAAVLSDLIAIGPGVHRRHFELLYALAWPEWQDRLLIKVVLRAPENRVDTVTGIWPCADWLEREVWDLYGIGFDGHPNLRRILLPDGFEGHPLQANDPRRDDATGAAELGE
jgi:NADH:ubiquinone oxidoreductase subunit C